MGIRAYIHIDVTCVGFYFYQELFLQKDKREKDAVRYAYIIIYMPFFSIYF